MHHCWFVESQKYQHLVKQPPSHIDHKNTRDARWVYFVQGAVVIVPIEPLKSTDLSQLISPLISFLFCNGWTAIKEPTGKTLTTFWF